VLGGRIVPQRRERQPDGALDGVRPRAAVVSERITHAGDATGAGGTALWTSAHAHGDPRYGRRVIELLAPGWEATALTHNPINEATGGIWRVRRGGETAVVKLAVPPRGTADRPDWETSADPRHWNYWKRELLAYRSGLADEAFAGVRAPALLDAVDRPDGSVALWLEDVAGTPGPQATPAQLGDLARRLADARAVPAYDWLSADWLRAYTLARPVPEPVAWDHPVTTAAWPRPLRDGLRTLWERRHDVLAATDRLPRTLCHHDVWPMNLVVAADGPVLFDWSFVGPGAVGEDAANLVLDTFLDGLVPVSRLDEVVALVLDGYGRRHEAAVMTAGAAKYFWLAPRMIGLLAAPAPTTGHYDRRGAHEMFEGRRPVLELLVSWARAAIG
jgi:hypothetical protein